MVGLAPGGVVSWWESSLVSSASCDSVLLFLRELRDVAMDSLGCALGGGTGLVGCGGVAAMSSMLERWGGGQAP